MSDMAVSSFGVCKNLLELIKHGGSGVVTSGILSQVGPEHLHLCPDLWVIVV